MGENGRRGRWFAAPPDGIRPMSAGGAGLHRLCRPMPAPRRLVARWIGRCPLPVWGVAPVERLRRSLARAGIWDAGLWAGAPPAECGRVLLIAADHVFDDALIQVLADAPPLVLVRGDGRPVLALAPRDRAVELAAVLAGATPPP